MNRDDIIRELGWTMRLVTDDELFDRIERIARLAAAHEREACCKIVYGQCESDNVAQRTVDAIRARFNNESSERPQIDLVATLESRIYGLRAELVEQFAALVAAEVAKCEGCGKPHALYCLKCCEESIVQTAVKEEREACARVCENIEYHDETIDDIYYSDHYAKAIRARGEA